MKLKSNYKLTFIISFLILFFVFISIPNTLANNNVYEISSFDDLVKYAELSRTNGYQNAVYKLTKDIVITKENQATLESSDFNYISYGTSDLPFSGTFDGQGHTIYNLYYDANLSIRSDTGLIKYASGATIKNLIIENADIESDYRGGIVVGYAENTLFENVTVRNSDLTVSASDNVLTLITDGGIRGGAIVGESVGNVLYNCEVENVFINSNNTSGVAALSGKGLTLGAIVGISDNTTIEYSRVLDGTVKIYYDVAVGAVGGNTLYVGGIVGKMKNKSKIIDSFSTANLNFYCATYVSVGAGNSGHIGGIAAEMSGEGNEIIRSHYAGITTSKQYNAVLVVPVIQNNVNISGIADVYENGAVVNTYFKSDLNPDAKMNVLGNDTSTSSYGPQDNTRYSDKEFWESANYDFSGIIKRSSEYSDEHYNRWIMDYEHGIPIHGKGVSATLDFPNAGSVKILPTELINSTVSTSNPYKFAVQGLKPNEHKINLIVTENDGYKFINWYKIPNISAWQLEEEHKYFEDVFSKNEPVYNEKEYSNVDCNNNDLFIARYQANVTFYDINGDVVSNDWYDYGDKIPDIIPNINPNGENAKLIGWTTVKSSEEGGGYSSITNTELLNLKSKNNFYEKGNSITKTLDLYPVYVDLISNVHTVFEGNEQDSSPDSSLRENVGYTEISTNIDGNVVIKAIGYENGDFPAGYKFLGWYNEEGVRVSSSKEYTLKDIDLTQQSTFTARFRYSIEYYIRAFSQNDGNSNTDSTLYTTLWQEYNTMFDSIPGPGYIREYITHWGTSHVNHGDSDSPTDAYSGLIKAPLKVYSHNYESSTGGSTSYNVSVDIDFPGSGQITDEKRGTGAKFRFDPVNSDRYHLLFWTLERAREGWSYIGNPMDTGILDAAVTYKAEAMVVTDLVFHNKNDIETRVTRRYNSNVFLNSDISHTYHYPFMHTDEVISSTPVDGETLNSTITLQASPTDESMKVPGYYFLGWISSEDLVKDSEEWNKVYDVSSDAYCTSSISKATPYLLSKDALVTKTLDLYPVYVKYNVVTKTNVIGLYDNMNIPDNPTYTLGNQQPDGKVELTIVPDLDTYINNNSDLKYSLSSLTMNGEVIEPVNGEYKYTIEPGKTYTFTANYEPLIVVYHLNDTDVKVELKQTGDTLGLNPEPTYNIDDLSTENIMYVFAGYSKTSPINSKYHIYDNYNDFESANISMVYQSMLVDEPLELYPVYIGTGVNVNSNIDDYLTANSVNLDSVRTLSRESISKTYLNVINTNIDNYYFEGWYKDYVNEDNPGVLISKNINYILETNENFEEKTYTAVYKEMYKVKYYNKSGEIIYETLIPKTENRSFVKNEVDNNNNTVETPIDYEAIENITSIMNNNEIFKNWSWVKDDNTIVPWDDFYNKTITQDMNLYPVVIEMNAYDFNDNLMNSINNDSKILFGYNKDSIYAELNTTYEGGKLTINVSEVCYTFPTETRVPMDNVKVAVYPNTTTEDSTIGLEATDSSGNAVFNFKGSFTITKKIVAGNKDTDSFIYKIVNKKNPDEVIKIISLKNGETVTISAPYGQYTVYEDNNWSWRNGENYGLDLVVNNYTNGSIIFDNIVHNNKWFDKITNLQNFYN